MIPESTLNQFIFYPDREIYATPAAYGLTAREIWFTTADDVRLHGWFFPNNNAIGTLLFFHGNAGNSSHRLDNIRLLLEINVQVFIIDYRGYGQSDGSPNEAGTYKDARAAWHWMVNNQVGPYFIFGRSIGGAIAVWLAAQEDVEPDALIIENSFTSGRELAGKLLILPTMARLLPNVYPSVDRMADINAPLMVIHGEKDELIPRAHGEKLYTAANPPKRLHLIANGHHNDTYFAGGASYWNYWREFLDSAISI